jgi:hypothetical protein
MSTKNSANKNSANKNSANKNPANKNSANTNNTYVYNNTNSLDNIYLQNLKNIGESINYGDVIQTIAQIEINSDYLDGLGVLQAHDKNIADQITNQSAVEKILKHVIKSSNPLTISSKTKYSPDENIVKNPKIKEDFFDKIMTGLNVHIFLLVIVRFYRLIYILCMNPTLSNNLIKIHKRQLKVIEWYSVVYTNLVELGLSLKVFNEKTLTTRQLYLDESGRVRFILDNIQALHLKCISNFTKLLNLKPEMELTSYGGSSKKYIKLQKGGKRLIRTGGRGGRYYMKGGNKIYIK